MVLTSDTRDGMLISYARPSSLVKRIVTYKDLAGVTLVQVGQKIVWQERTWTITAIDPKRGTIALET